jgi:hypothetical protein
MANTWSVDALIRSMRTRGFLPAGNGLTNTQLLEIISEEAGLYIPALLKSIREEYLVTSLDVAVSAGTPESIPPRACGAALRSVQWVEGDSVWNLVRIEPEAAYQYPEMGTPYGYYFEGNDINILPGRTGTVRLRYMQRPGRMVLESACALINSVNTASNLIFIDNLPSTFAVNTVVDIVRGTENFGTMLLDATLSVVSTSVITISGGYEIPSDVAAGDFVCLAGTTCIPPFPPEVHPVLAQRVAQVLAMANGSERIGAISEGLKQARADLMALLSPRDDGSARAIIRKNSPARRGQ